jgi:hypothetical protein
MMLKVAVITKARLKKRPGFDGSENELPINARG